MAVGSKLQLEPGSWAEFAYDVTIGFAVGAAHSLYLVGRWVYLHILRVLQLFGIDSNNSQVNEGRDGEKALKVVAVGYGRTGTVRSTSNPPWRSIVFLSLASVNARRWTLFRPLSLCSRIQDFIILSLTLYVHFYIILSFSAMDNNPVFAYARFGRARLSDASYTAFVRASRDN